MTTSIHAAAKPRRPARAALALLLPVAVLLVVLPVLQPAAAQQLPHPGGWHTAADVARVRSKVAARAEPWFSAFMRLLNDSSLTLDYSPNPKATVSRPGSGDHELMQDAMAAYYAMLRWMGTGNSSHADLAQRIIDAWSDTITGFAGHDQMLAAGIYGSHFAQAAELLSVAKPGDLWPLKARAQDMFRDVFHPVCDNFCGRTSTGPPQPSPQNCSYGANGNWDTSCMSAVASWSVFLDNATMLQTVADYYANGRGNGRLTHYIINSAGECQESGRDQAHTQDGLEHLTETALTLWHATNRTDVFTMADFRLRAGLEYTARYNLGYDVPFVPTCGAYPAHRDSCFSHLSNKSRGDFSAMWEMAAAIYGSSAPYTQQIVNRPGYRPEGHAPPIISNSPHMGDGPPGQGTLTFFGMTPPDIIGRLFG